MASKMIQLVCATCCASFEVLISQWRYHGTKYCSRQCSHIGRRLDPEVKRQRDNARRREYWSRPENIERKRQRGRDAYDPAKAKAHREANRELIAAQKRRCYLRPEYRAFKAKKDREYRCRKGFGEFWESASLLIDLDRSIEARMPDYEVRKTKGTINKALRRKREFAASQRQELERVALGSTDLGQIR